MSPYHPYFYILYKKVNSIVDLKCYLNYVGFILHFSFPQHFILRLIYIGTLELVHLCKLLCLNVCKMKGIQVVFSVCFVNYVFVLILARDCLWACFSRMSIKKVELQSLYLQFY